MMKKMFFTALAVVFFFPQVSCALTVSSGLTVAKVVLPGEKTGGVIVLTGGESAETVRIYQTDYMFYADGRNEFGKPGSAPRSNASWITYVPNQLILQPHGRAEVSYQISVPNDEDLRGTYWSVIMVEPVPALYVDLTDPSGRPLGRYEGGKLRIFPGCSVRYAVDLGPLKPGKYNALVIADCGEDKVFGARYVLEVK